MASTFVNPRFPSQTRYSDLPNHARISMDRATSLQTTPHPPYAEPRRAKTSLDITQKLEAKLAQLNASGSILKRWSVEIISWIVSALCIALIVGTLLRINNKHLSGNDRQLTLYNVVSKIASAALILPTSEALGQLKWDWFNGKKSKEMWDFEIFDKASREAWGSVLLLFRTKGRSLAAMGAVLTLLLIANDTFFQQVVDLPERWSLKGNSSISQVIRYESQSLPEYRAGAAVSQIDTVIFTALRDFFYANGTQPSVFGNGTRPDIPVYCPTTNCTFPEYETLAACSKCADISHLLQFGCATTNADWINDLPGYTYKYPNGTMCGYFINATSDSPVLMSGYSTTNMTSLGGPSPAGEALLLRLMPLSTNPSRKSLWGGSINFKSVRNPIFNVVVVAGKSGPAGVYRNETPAALECVLSWCVKSMKSSYYLATYKEEVNWKFANTTQGRYPWVSEQFTSPLFNGTDVYYTENVTITPPTKDYSYGMDNTTHFRVAAIFDDIFPAFLTTENMTATPIFRYKTNIEGAAFLRKLEKNPWVPPNNVTHHMERMATALTNVLRSSPSKEMIDGSAYDPETFISVQWAWLTFPFALLALSLIFLVATIIKTSKGAGENDPGVWKTSAMPALIYSLPSHMQKQFTSSTEGNASPDRARNLRIRLHPKTGWRISGHPCSPDTPVLAVRSNQPPPGWI